MNFQFCTLGWGGDTHIYNLNFKTHLFMYRGSHGLLVFYQFCAFLNTRGWLVIWYNGPFEGGQLCDTKSPCREARVVASWQLSKQGIYWPKWCGSTLSDFFAKVTLKLLINLRTGTLPLLLHIYQSRSFRVLLEYSIVELEQ